MVSVAISIAFFLVAASDDKLVATPPDTSAQTAVAATKDNDRMICRRKRVTGSRLGTTKVCKHRSEWDKEAEDAFQQLQRVRDVPTGDPGPQ